MKAASVFFIQLPYVLVAGWAGRSAAAPIAKWPADARGALRWVSTNNPFYVISAGLFLAGLWISFGDPRQMEDTWVMMAGLVSGNSRVIGVALALPAGTEFRGRRYPNRSLGTRTSLFSDLPTLPGPPRMT